MPLGLSKMATLLLLLLPLLLPLLLLGLELEGAAKARLQCLVLQVRLLDLVWFLLVLHREMLESL